MSGKLGVRAVAYDRRDAGYIDNTARNQQDVNSLRVHGGRVAVLAEPTDGLRITGTAIYQRMNAADAPYAMLVGDALTFNSRVPASKRSDLSVFNLAAEYDLGWASLYSSSTYARKVTFGQSDLTGSFGPVLTSFGVTPAPLVPYTTNDYGTTFTQEVRLASNADQRLTWLVGGFYKYNARQAHFDLTVPGAGRALSRLGFPSDSLFHADIPVPARELAAFGEVSYKITPQIEATAGLRVFRDKSSYGEHTTGFVNGGETRTSRQTAENSYTPKFALAWKPSTDLNFYVQASKGYRVGQSNPAIPNDPVTGQPRGGAYGPDSLWNYEIGAKTSWLDNRLIANVAVYYIDWSDIQMDQATPDNFTYIANIGQAHSVGAEVEITARPLRNVELTTAFSINDARLDTDNAVAKAVKGQRLPGSPRFTISNAAQVGFDFPTGIPGYVRAEHQYIGGQNSDFNPAYNVRYGDYNVVNLRVGAQLDKVEAVLFATNVANDRSNVMASGVGTLWAVRLPPRTIGITLRADF